MSTRSVGNQAEELACQYLQKRGYKILARNFTIRGGEVDIIARDGDELVFVEVKARSSHLFGTPLESITYHKLQAIQKSALFYIQKNNWSNQPYRIDAVSVDYTGSSGVPQIELSKNITL